MNKEIKTENAANTIGEFVTAQTDQLVELIGTDVDMMLGWLVHRAGNMELIDSRELDDLLMTIDNHRITLEFTDNCADVVADEVEINVENLQKAVRRIVAHDYESVWTTKPKGDRA